MHEFPVSSPYQGRENACTHYYVDVGVQLELVIVDCPCTSRKLPMPTPVPNKCRLKLLEAANQMLSLRGGVVERPQGLMPLLNSAVRYSCLERFLCSRGNKAWMDSNTVRELSPANTVFGRLCFASLVRLGQRGGVHRQRPW